MLMAHSTGGPIVRPMAARDKLQRFRHYLAAFLATILSSSSVEYDL